MLAQPPLESKPDVDASLYPEVAGCAGVQYAPRSFNPESVQAKGLNLYARLSAIRNAEYSKTHHQKIDTKSLVQTLNETRCVRTLSTLSLHSEKDVKSNNYIDTDAQVEIAVDGEATKSVRLSHLRHDNPMPAKTIAPLTLDVLVEFKKVCSEEKNKTPENRRRRNACELREYREELEVIRQSLFYNFSDPQRLLKCFNECWDWSARGASEVHHHETIDSVLGGWDKETEEIVLESLWMSLADLFNPPRCLRSHQKGRPDAPYQNGTGQHSAEATTGSASKDHQVTPFEVDDDSASRIFTICVCAIVGIFPDITDSAFDTINTWTKWGGTRSPKTLSPRDHRDVMGTYDILEEFQARRLCQRLLRAIAARTCFSEAMSFLDHGRSSDVREQQSLPVTEALVKQLQEVELHRRPREDGRQHRSIILQFRLWVFAAFSTAWDMKPIVNRWGVAGSAIQCLEWMCKFSDIVNKDLFDRKLGTNRAGFLLGPDTFPVTLIDRHLGDEQNLARSFMEYKPDPNTLHLARYPFLMSGQNPVATFRAINFSRMSKALDEAKMTMAALGKHNDLLTAANLRYLAEYAQSALQNHTKPCLSVNVRRDHILEDAFDALFWRRKRELLLPMKIRLGHEAGGEEGVDQGGVSMEFFRLAFADALDPRRGMFAMDTSTKMTWFQPASLEPHHRYELLGILMGLALYNGVTLPITFPKVFYRKLFGHVRFGLEDIKDGWPRLAKGLKELLEWTDGDVGDIFVRTYDFSFAAFGENIDVNMEAYRDHIWPDYHIEDDEKPTPDFLRPSSKYHESDMLKPAPYHNLRSRALRRPYTSVTKINGSANRQPEEAQSDAEESILVTNENRKQYVLDYVDWLVNASIHAEYEAFEKGFFTVIDRKALDVLDVHQLQALIEGYQEIDVDELEQHTRYSDGYNKFHPHIRMFWSIVRQYDQNQRKALLEFVTASDRVPVTGIQNLKFTIQDNGADTDRLPTSSTCFTSLLLPRYDTREKMKQKLDIALANSKGFGTP